MTSSSGSGGTASQSGGTAGASSAGSSGSPSNGGSAGAGGSAGMGGTKASGGSGGTLGASGNGGTSGTAGSSTGGSAGTGPTVIYDRDYQFDSDTAPFALSQYGSTPNVGSAGGPEKLSAKSTLSQDDAYGSPNKGSAKLSIPFTQYDEQLDFNSEFDGSRENWTGYKASARIKIISGGNADGSCPLLAWIYITATADYTFGRGTTVEITSTWQDIAYDFAIPAEGDPDLTAVNQLGIQIFSNSDSDCSGSPSFSTATIVIDNFQVHKP